MSRVLIFVCMSSFRSFCDLLLCSVGVVVAVL